jgi:hypothetical protein
MKTSAAFNFKDENNEIMPLTQS